MENAEKGLEETLLEIGNRLLSPPSAVDDLLSLLDETETLLSRVQQSPSQSMSTALRPALNGLIAKELLGHSDTNVKVAVASCISEITRITAPEAPYDDDLMKEIFQKIVEAFEKLDDMHSRSYSKRVSILETVAKVRSCVVMLDLECDTLILDMFHHFLKTIRESHTENVFSSMEMIMTVVLEESEDISSNLLSCLLTSVKKDNKDMLPIARRLAEKVIVNSASKLKPCLMEAVQSLGSPLDDYSEIVTSVCRKNSDVVMHNGMNISKSLADDSKLSLRTVSDELQKGSGKPESEVACAGEVGSAAVKSLKSLMSNGAVQNENGDSSVPLTSLNTKIEHSGRSILCEHTATSGVETDKVDTALDCNTNETMGHNSNSLIQSAEVTDQPQIDSDKEAVERLNQSKESSVEVNNSHSETATCKEAEAAALESHGERAELQPPSEKSPNDRASAISTTPSEKFPDKARSKRGRPPGSKGSSKKQGIHADVPVSPTGVGKSSVNEHSKNEAMPSIGAISKKQDEDISDSDPKTPRHLVKKGPLRNKDKGGKPSTDSHSKLEVEVMSDLYGKLRRRTGSKPSSEGEIGKRQASKTKQKSKVSSDDNAVGDPIFEEKISSPKTYAKADKEDNQLAETPKMKSQKKRAREKEISETPCDEQKYDESLVGAKIKVWWPDDEEFYPGVVDSYDPVSMKHKVLYVDGDEEDLLMKDEVFEFVKGDEDEGNAGSTPVATFEIQRKRTKTFSSSFERSKVVTSSKGGGSSAGKGSGGGTESGRKHGVDAIVLGGRRGSNTKSGSKTDNRTPTRGKSKEKTGSRSHFGIPKTSATSKDEPSNRSIDGSQKVTTKFKDDISEPAMESKDKTPKSGTALKNASKDGMAKAGSKAKHDVVTSGTKSRDNVTKSDGKSNEIAKSMAKRKRKSSSTIDSVKSDANGTPVKGKTGSPEGNKNDAAADTNFSNTQVPQGSGERTGKKRRK